MPCSQDNTMVLELRTVSPFTLEAFQHVCTLHIGINASFVIRHSKMSRQIGSYKDN